MKKLLAVLFGACVCSALFSASCDAEEPIRIGLSAPLTGQYAGQGKSFDEAIRLAIDAINKAGGVKGHSVELVAADSQGSPKIAKRVAREFAKNKKIVAVLGDQTSSCSMAAQPIYHRAGMVQLSPTASHPSYAPGSPYSFSIVGTMAGEGAFMARRAVSRLGRKRIAVAYLNTDWGSVTKKFFIEEATRLGAEIVSEEPYLDGTTDFSALVGKVRAAKPELLYLASMSPDAVGISRQCHKDAWKDVIIMGASPLYNPEFIKLGADAVENVFTCTPFFPDDPKPEVRNFIKTFEARYNRVPKFYAAIAFDAMNLLEEAMRQGGTDRKGIHDGLSGIREFSGVTGKISFSKHGDVDREYVFLHVKQGKFAMYPQK